MRFLPLLALTILLSIGHFEPSFGQGADYFRNFKRGTSEESVSSEEEESFDENEDAAESDLEYDFDFDNWKKETKRQATQDFLDRMLEMHNEFRARHGSPPLTMDAGLNKQAQAYAELQSKKNIHEHSCGPCDKYGENLAYRANTRPIPTGAAAAEWACNAWYDEISLYNFAKPGSGDMHKWGHFTALVWKSSTKVGFGVKYGTKKSAKTGNTMNTVHVVAHYLPPGNMLTPEAMAENVPPLLK